MINKNTFSRSKKGWGSPSEDWDLMETNPYRYGMQQAKAARISLLEGLIGECEEYDEDYVSLQGLKDYRDLLNRLK